MSEPRALSLSLTENYAASWRTWEGVREFVQNWYDGLLSSLESVPGIGTAKLSITKYHNYSYKATVASSTNNGEPLKLGSLIYRGDSQSLALVNHNTALQRKVLLLGYSKKSSHHDIIGQFGEGLKVGALALLRSGQEVAMVTSQDSWRFRLAVDSMFQERVLTIFITDRSQDQVSLADMTPECPADSQWDTCVQIWPLAPQEWTSMASKFLFLEPAADSAETELGTLLLDSHLQGQLFVKQVWVSDQTKDGLSVGVNFKNLRIDRDRRAVVHQSDIDHQVSSMWIRALKIRPDLSSRYFQMLEQNSACDVRHASYYMEEAATASLIAWEFFRKFGEQAVPVLNCTAADTLHTLSQELQEKVVLCNRTLLDILTKSGRVRSAEDILKQRTALMRKRVLMSSLTQEELSSVSHAVALVKIALPDIQSSNIDIHEGQDNTVTCAGSQFEVPLWMVRRDQVHAKAPCKSTATSSCQCVAAFLCQRILSAHNGAGQNSEIHHVVGSLAQQVCKEVQPFCMKLHSSESSKDQATESTSVLLLQQREREFQQRIEGLQSELQETEHKHKQDLTDLKAKMSSLEHQLTKEEVRFVDMEQHLIDSFRREGERKDKQYQESVLSHQTRYDALYSEFLSKSDELEHVRRDLESCQQQLSDERQRQTRHVDSLKSQSEWYLKRLADRVDKLSELHSANSGLPPSDSELATLLHSIAREFEDDKRKNLCLVCASNAKDTVLLPCRHHHTCRACAQVLPKCPVCRTVIASVLHVYS